MNRAIVSATVLPMLAIAASAHAAGDPEAGRAKANTCAVCHGTKGEGRKPYPALAGKPPQELQHALEDYRSGKRKSSIMTGLAAKLTDRDIADLAAYYASLK